MQDKIKIIRGTTTPFEIYITDDKGNPYEITKNQFVVFGIKKHPDDKGVLVAKKATAVSAGVFQVVLNPEDTAELDIGWYYCDAGVETEDGFYNAVPPTLFELAMNVTYRGCAG